MTIIKQYVFTRTHKVEERSENDVLMYRSMIKDIAESMSDENIMIFFRCYYIEHEGEKFYEIKLNSHDQHQVGKIAFLVYDMNKNLISVASSWAKAVLIYKSRFKKLPKRISDVIKMQVVDEY